MSESHLRAHVEAALRESEAKFQTLLETASVGIVLVDEQGYIVLVNGKAEEMFRYPREELIGQKVELLLPERYQPTHVSHRADYLNDPGVRSMGHGRDLMALRKDGSEFPVEVGLSYIRTSEGLLTMSFITEITERKAAEVSLRRYAQRLESMREIDRAILSAELPEEIANGALTRLQKATPYLHISVMLFDFAVGEALVLASSGPASNAPREGECLALESFGNVEVLQEGDHVLMRAPGRVEGAQASLKMPLCVEDELIGLLYLASERADDFNDEQLEIAHDVANQLAVALQQAQLREDMERHALDLERRVVERTHEIERRREVAEGLRDMLALLNSNRPLEEILDYIVALAGRLLGSDASALYHLPTGEGPLAIVAARGLSDEYVSTMNIAVGQGAVGQAVQGRQPVAVSHITRFLEAEGMLLGESEQQEMLRYSRSASRRCWRSPWLSRRRFTVLSSSTT
ncbi:MAG: PAS domain S-box protein, partial [Ardenticatenales bacterium]|nr:PAS domain S-box protein [Ardenticatenales bacterium]